MYQSFVTLMKRLLLLAGVLALAACAAPAPQSPVLSIEGGLVQGVPADVPGVTVFRGIPFAAPPLG